MGKKKLRLKSPSSYQEGQANYNRRLPGLIKKANEIAELTSSRVFLLITDPNWNSVVIYSNDYIDTFFAAYQNTIQGLLESESQVEVCSVNKKVKIEEDCQYVDPEAPIIDISMDKDETIAKNTPAFYLNHRPLNDYMLPFDFKDSYLPLARAISNTQYLKNKSKERVRRLTKEAAAVAVRGSSIHPQDDTSEVPVSTNQVGLMDKNTLKAIQRGKPQDRHQQLDHSHAADESGKENENTNNESDDEDYGFPKSSMKLFEDLLEK